MSSNASPGANVPSTFREYLVSMGPGIVMALTWLGAGDLVDAAVAGGNYGYALMWAMVIALFMRFIFVSILAKYQLCNQRRESVMEGFRRIHAIMPILVGVFAIIFSHFLGSYFVKGTGEACARFVGVGPPWAWSVFWVTLAALLVFKGMFSRIEFAFYILLGILSLSLIGVALWSGPSPLEAARGVFLLSIPEQKGPFGVLLVVTSLIGAVGGSITNLFYPYFIHNKGWRGPKYRRLQLYDLAFGILVLIVLDLAIWTVGAEILHPTGRTIESIEDLAGLLTVALGHLGGSIFYLGVFAAVFSSVIGNAIGFGYVAADVARVLGKKASGNPSKAKIRSSRIYRAMVIWSLFSPLFWTLPGTPSFVTLTIIVNAAQVITLPVLAGGVWYITARTKFIGSEHRNNWAENSVLAFLFLLALWVAWNSVSAIAGHLFS